MSALSNAGQFRVMQADVFGLLIDPSSHAGFKR